MLKKKQALKYLFLIIAVQLFTILLIVYLFDPFYQYHTPYFGLKTVLYDRETQVPGSIRTFSYDSVLLGTSVMENCDSTYLDQHFSCHTLKVIKASGSNTDLLYYLALARDNRDLKYVFWGLDWHALTSSTELTVVSAYTPSYLFTASPLDDFSYFYNKDVLFKKLPLSLAYSFADMYTDGHAYDWSEGKEFGAAAAMRDYEKPAEALPVQDYTEDIPLILENIEMITDEIKNHPETEYYILFPPYSLLMWDNVYVNGEEDKYFYMLDEVLSAILPLENARIYYFQADRDIVCNLDHYMDKMHYSPAINQIMLENLVSDRFSGISPYRVTLDNLEEIKQDMKDTYTYIITEGIYRYYER